MSAQVWMLETLSLPRAEFAALEAQWGGLKRGAAIELKYNNGEPLALDEFPKWLGEVDADTEHHENVVEAGRRPPKRKLFPLPVLFDTGFTFANTEAAEVLANFELGSSILLKLDLYARDLKTKYEQATATWVNVTELQSLMDAENSTRLRTASRDGTRWMASDSSELVLTSLPHVDLWRDPQLTRSLFFTDRLAQALMKLKGGKRLKFKPCRMGE